MHNIECKNHFFLISLKNITSILESLNIEIKSLSINILDQKGGENMSLPILNIEKYNLTSHDLQLIPVKYIKNFVAFFNSLDINLKKKILEMDNYLERIKLLIELFISI